MTRSGTSARRFRRASRRSRRNDDGTPCADPSGRVPPPRSVPRAASERVPFGCAEAVLGPNSAGARGAGRHGRVVVGQHQHRGVDAMARHRPAGSRSAPPVRALRQSRPRATTRPERTLRPGRDRAGQLLPPAREVRLEETPSRPAQCRRSRPPRSRRGPAPPERLSPSVRTRARPTNRVRLRPGSQEVALLLACDVDTPPAPPAHRGGSTPRRPGRPTTIRSRRLAPRGRPGRR